MTLKQTLSTDIIQAMKDKDTTKKAVLTILKSNIQNEEIKLKRDLTEDDELTILNRERKQIKDSIEGFTNANRLDLVEKEQLKLVVVESYLPKQLSKEDILTILEVKGVAKGDNVGKWIGVLSKDLKGKVDGKTLATIVREYITSLDTPSGLTLEISKFSPIEG